MRPARTIGALLAALLAACVALGGCGALDLNGGTYLRLPAQTFVGADAVPPYAGEPHVQLDGNEPSFTDEELARAEAGCFEDYGPLDPFGRCTGALACVGRPTMPALGEEREPISEVRPSGWRKGSYDFIDGGSLYNRCHLVAWMLGAENANPRNLITGTRYLNTEGMLPLEQAIARYVYDTDGTVLMRVTPDFREGDLVARGVRMEARSMEDGGRALRFDVYCYNVQPGVGIDYATGEHWLEGEAEGAADGAALPEASLGSAQTFGEGSSASGSAGAAARADGASEATAGGQEQARPYVLNTRSRKFHDPSCSGAAGVSASNRRDVTTTRSELLDQGFEPCGACRP